MQAEAMVLYQSLCVSTINVELNTQLYICRCIEARTFKTTAFLWWNRPHT